MDADCRCDATVHSIVAVPAVLLALLASGSSSRQPADFTRRSLSPRFVFPNTANFNFWKEKEKRSDREEHIIDNDIWTDFLLGCRRSQDHRLDKKRL
jgi:hypothetical protein